MGTFRQIECYNLMYIKFVSGNRGFFCLHWPPIISLFVSSCLIYLEIVDKDHDHGCVLFEKSTILLHFICHLHENDGPNHENANI